MDKYLVRAALAACFATLISIPIAAQNAAQDTGIKAQATQDTHIKNDNPTNSVGDKIAPPPSKGGPKAKGPGGTCRIHVDNRTGLIVQFYFQGHRDGVVGPWGDLVDYITPGNAQLYGRAIFDDGSELTFGPRGFACLGDDFTWTLAL
ncbi:MAG TPA: hypothetical protein VFE08_04410 [Candidatus Sulfotelmatobacter sp.]|nr:hypothetical protein [Candidatus Sulfotelmatobacter sp.]